MADNMSIDKKDVTREGSEDSMELNSPTPEAETGAPQENVGQQKRKGGRKPVRFIYIYRHCITPPMDTCVLIDPQHRSMLRLKNGSSEIVKLRQPLGSAGQSISSS
jgi:hypothetical protein